MKFTNFSNLKSFVGICPFLIVLIFTVTSSTSNLPINKSQAIDLIQNQLDDLIQKFENNNNINSNQPLISDNKISLINTNSNVNSMDFSDEVIDAFQSLNHDFLEYENILMNDVKGENKSRNILNKLEKSKNNDKISLFQEENNKIKHLYETNERNFKKLNNLHNDNLVNTNELNKNGLTNDSNTNKYYDEIESLTSDISNSFESFEKLEKIEEKKKIINQKITLIHDIQQSLSNMKENIELIKNEKNEVIAQKGKVHDLAEKLYDLYNQYLSLEKNIDSKSQEDLDKIKKIINSSHATEENIKNYYYVLGEFNKFYDKIKGDEIDLEKVKKEEEINNKFEIFGKFISQIYESDNKNIAIRYYLFLKIKFF